MRVQTARTDTADRVLDLAERLVQTRGFNGFSYADIAGELGVTKASLHYHFPTKAELGRRLIDRYGEAFAQALADIDASSTDARVKLRRYASLYARVLRDDRMCLCGMMAADYATLPEPMKSAVTQLLRSERAVVGLRARAGARQRRLALLRRTPGCCALAGRFAGGGDARRSLLWRCFPIRVHIRLAARRSGGSRHASDAPGDVIPTYVVRGWSWQCRYLE